MSKKHVDYTNWSKDELIKELKRIKETTYGLVWHRDVPQEKIDVLINPDARTPEEMFANEVAGKPFPVLKEVKSKEVISNKDDQTHILIEGDNYHSLAVLNFTHQEAIDVIYIDPPYNTGNNDFIYTDNFKSGYVDKEDPFRHSKWLSFMEKRLKLSQKLLKSTGVIFISIDDNEYAPLKMLCDEIFGEQNFVAPIIVNSNSSKNNSKYIGVSHEYILVYAKDINRLQGQWKVQKNNVNEFRKRAKQLVARNLSTEDIHKELLELVKYPRFYDFDHYTYADKIDVFRVDNPGGVKNGNKKTVLIHPGTGKPCPIPDGGWRYKEEELKRLAKENLLYFGENEKNIPAPKRYLKDYLTQVPKSSVFFDSQSSTKELKGMKIDFDFPKATKLIKYIISMYPNNKSATILDFMAGSGTTGHAVLDLNNEDGGNRKFILCTNNENKIATDVCQPRLEKVMKGYTKNNSTKINGHGGNLKYYTAYDFVESEPSDKNKHKLVNKCTEMLCIKEGIYDLVSETEDYKILKSNDDRYLGIIFYEDAIDEYKKAIKKIDAQINTYVFSLGDDPHTAQFADVADKVALQAIPEIILKVYQEIFK